MKDKEMIEEMAKLIDDRLIEANGYLGSMNRGEGYWIAQKLIEHYQPKLPKDSVVLSGEEYELYEVVKKGYPNDMTCLVEKFTEISHNSYTRGSKETAEKILNKVYWLVAQKDVINVLTRIKEIATREGVEIKE